MAAFPLGKGPHTREAGWALEPVRCRGEDKNLLPVQGIEVRSLGRADSSLVTIPTTPSLLIRSGRKRTDYFFCHMSFVSTDSICPFLGGLMSVPQPLNISSFSGKET